MTTVAGVFRSKESAARAVRDLQQAGLRRINLIAPESIDKTDAVPTTDTEQPGMGKAVGRVLGAALGIAGGFELGTAAATLVLPGVGPVLALGIGAAALLGASGAVGGAAAGAALEEASTAGLPADELFVYKNALRQGRTVVFVEAGDPDEAARARQTLEGEDAESIDAAREEWWIGLRSAEQEHYRGLGRNFEPDEPAYRLGFETALRRGNADRAIEGLDDAGRAAFRCGYERGIAHRRDA